MRGRSTFNGFVPKHGNQETIKAQVCPHGTSLPCSQCLGAKAKKVTIHPKSKAILVDGVRVRDSMIPADLVESTQKRFATTMTSGTWDDVRAIKLCTLCGGRDHSRKSCIQRSKMIMKEPIK